MAAKNLEASLVKQLLSKPHIRATRDYVESLYDKAFDAKDKARVDELSDLRRLLGEHDKRLNAEPAKQAAAVQVKR